MFIMEMELKVFIHLFIYFYFLFLFLFLISIEILGGKNQFLFISIHVGSIYPFTGEDKSTRESNVVNISLEQKTSSAKYHEVFDAIVIPKLEAFEPDLLLISAGFDAHKDDQTGILYLYINNLIIIIIIGAMQLKSSDYFDLTEKLKKVAEKYCGGKIISVLEGGYDLNSLQDSVQEHILSLISK
jgi:acetoin utilization deacetylase AcuC-like enzyme